jgi:hypothetical protein
MMVGIALDEGTIPRKAWSALLAEAGRSGLQQGWAYGEALRQGGIPVARLVLREGTRPLALAQVAERRLFGLARIAFLLRGPAWLARVDEGQRRAVLGAVRARLGRCAVIWTPEQEGPVGRRPVMTGYSTAWLDLAAGSAALRRGLDARWRNHLRQAERCRLDVQTCRRGGPLLDWLLDGNERHRRKVGYRGPAPAFLARLAHAAAEGGDLLLLVAREGTMPVAGVMLVRHGAAATYEVGYTSPRGRELSATHLLLWRGVELLATDDVRWLDLGGLSTPGIAGFKLGLGAEVATLAGTFFIPPVARSL